MGQQLQPGLGWAAWVFCSPLQPWIFVWNVTKPQAALSVAEIRETISLGVGGTEQGRALGWQCCCPGDTQASLPAVRRVVQNCVVEGFIHLLSGCADKSPVITGNKAIMTICFNISANTPFYETFFPFLFCRLKGTAWKDAFHFSLRKHTAYGRYLSHSRMGLPGPNFPWRHRWSPECWSRPLWRKDGYFNQHHQCADRMWMQQLPLI